MKRAKQDTHRKYSNASSLACRISSKSEPSKLKLVGSISNVLSFSSLAPGSNELDRDRDSVSDIGPTIKDGHMTGSTFSRCKVKSLPDFDPCNDSEEMEDEARLLATYRGESARE